MLSARVTAILWLALSAAQAAGDEAVDPERLYELIGSADRVVVKAAPTPGAKTLFVSTDQKDLAALRRALVIQKPEHWFHCACLGERQHPGELAQVPRVLKDRLWDYVKNTKDKDKRARAAKAFRRNAKPGRFDRQ